MLNMIQMIPKRQDVYKSNPSAVYLSLNTSLAQKNFQRQCPANRPLCCGGCFLTYTMIFGFRKSYTVCTFDGMRFAGLNYKTILVLSQMIGYLLAKFYGIKFISELKRLGPA
jgi:hypothetical protein